MRPRHGVLAVEAPFHGPAGADPAWRVINRSCVDAGGLVERQPPADFFFTDPPYNIGVDYHGDGGKSDSMPEFEYLVFLQQMLKVAACRLRGGGTLAVMLPDEWADDIGVYLKRDLGMPRRNWIKWHETFGTNQDNKFSRCSRHVLVHVKTPLATHWFNGDAVRVPSARQTEYADKRANPAGKVPDDVWAFSRVAGTFHERCGEVPTQVPEAILDRLVRAYTNPGGRVLEFCAGSGSLGRVCVRTGRRYEGWEVDGPTAAVAARRISEVGIEPVS